MTLLSRIFSTAPLSAALALLFCLLLPPEASGKVYLDINAPGARKVPLAIEDFEVGGKKFYDRGRKVSDSLIREKSIGEFASRSIMRTLRGDLEFAGFFDIIERDAHLESSSKSKKRNFDNWRAIGAELLITCKLTVEGDTLTAELRLFDTVKERQITGSRYIGRIISPRTVAHRFADEVMLRLTGERGIFSTRILFIADKTGNKEVYMADYDGENVRQVTYNGSINISPIWSPDAKKMLYTSYREGTPILYTKEFITGRDTAISTKPGLNIGGRWAPGGDKVALTLSINKTPELYVLDLNTKLFRRLTNNHGIDVSPSWSPDGRQLAYVSDIAGNPHIYVINARGGRPKRYTYESNYNTSPAWSPDGKFITYASMRNGKFDIWVMRSDGTGKKQLTFTGNNEQPSWSPDSRYIVFSSNRKGNSSSIYLIHANGTGLRKLDIGFNNELSPSWSPFVN